MIKIWLACVTAAGSEAVNAILFGPRRRIIAAAVDVASGVEHNGRSKICAPGGWCRCSQQHALPLCPRRRVAQEARVRTASGCRLCRVMYLCLELTRWTSPYIVRRMVRFCGFAAHDSPHSELEDYFGLVRDHLPTGCLCFIGGASFLATTPFRTRGLEAPADDQSALQPNTLKTRKKNEGMIEGSQRLSAQSGVCPYSGTILDRTVSATSGIVPCCTIG